MPITDINFSNDEDILSGLESQIEAIFASGAGEDAVAVATVAAPEAFIAALAILPIFVAGMFIVKKTFGTIIHYIRDIPVFGGALSTPFVLELNLVNSIFGWIDTGVKRVFAPVLHTLFQTSYNVFHREITPYGNNIQRLQQDMTTNVTILQNEIDQTNKLLSSQINKEANDYKNLSTVIASEIAQEKLDYQTLSKLIASLDARETADVNAINTRITAVQNALQNNINTLSSQVQDIARAVASINTTIAQTIGPEISSLQTTAGEEETSIKAEEGTISTLETTVSTTQQSIEELQGEVNQQAQQQKTTSTPPATALDWTPAEIATLTELADNPCLCLDPIGGIEVLMALIGGLEVGVL